MTEIIPQTGRKITYSYDLRGKRLTETGTNFNINMLDTVFSYDLENKLKTVTKGTAVTTMTYYADGMRVSKTTSNGTTYYIYDQSGRVVAEGQNTTSISANYVWGPDRVLEKKDSGGGIYYYLYNGHGDVIQMVDRNGNVVNNYSYDEWGNITSNTETISNPFKYAGEVYDQETGLYYLRARYYDPVIGRFISEDSFEGQVNNPLSLNLYTYCMNKPPDYVDPSGHSSYSVHYHKGENYQLYNDDVISDVFFNVIGYFPVMGDYKFFAYKILGLKEIDMTRADKKLEKNLGKNKNR